MNNYSEFYSAFIDATSTDEIHLLRFQLYSRVGKSVTFLEYRILKELSASCLKEFHSKPINENLDEDECI